MIKTIDKIKHEALILFFQRGYEATSVRDIAERVGINASSIYSHYKSKDILFIEIFNNCNAKYASEIHEKIDFAGKTPKEKLFNLCENKLKFFNNNPYIMGFMRRNAFFPPNELRERLNDEIKKNGNNAFLKNYKEIYDELAVNDQIKEHITLNNFISSFQRVYIGYSIQKLELDYQCVEEMTIEEIFDLYWGGVINK